MNITAHFSEEEIRCKCGCGEVSILDDSIILLERARVIGMVPFHINSGYRCPRHPDYKESSSHNGYAYDIRTANSQERLAVLVGLILAGFRRIGVGKDFIHADNDPNKPEASWHYYKDYIPKDVVERDYIKKEG